MILCLEMLLMRLKRLPCEPDLCRVYSIYGVYIECIYLCSIFDTDQSKISFAFALRDLPKIV